MLGCWSCQSGAKAGLWVVSVAVVSAAADASGCETVVVVLPG